MLLYFITGNESKYKEAQHILSPIKIKQLNIDLPEIQEINPKNIVEFKLNEAFKYKNGNFIVEDTSLYLNCLNGLPGSLIKWFLKTINNNGIFKISKLFRNNKAIAKTTIGYAKTRKNIKFFEGEIQGEIIAPSGNNGFGWDCIFKPEGTNKTFAQMNLKEKNKFSMRKIAFEKLKEYLTK